MPCIDDSKQLLQAAQSYTCCSSRLIAGFEQLLADLSVSSSLTSRRYSVWSAVRRNMDDAFLESLASFKGDWGQELLADCRLSEMGKYAPPVYAVPNGTLDPAYAQAWTERDEGWAKQMLESSQKPHLQPDIPIRPLADGWDLIYIPKRLDRPAEVLPVNWQLKNMGYWQNNFQCALQNLGPRTDDNCQMLDTFDLIFYQLIPLLRRFRPTRTTTHPEYESLSDSQTGTSGGSYCELCWRLTARSIRLAEIDRSAVDRKQASRERIRAGRLSNRYCALHKPGTAQYHSDLRYKAAFQTHIDVLHGRRASDYAFNLLPPDAPDMQEIRKLAYDQVHSGLHPIAPKAEAGLGLREKVWLMHLEGLSQSDMARRLGISRQAISKAKKSLESLMNAHRAGSYINPHTGEAQVHKGIIEAINVAAAKGKSVAVIAEKVKLTKGTVDGLIQFMRAHSK